MSRHEEANSIPVSTTEPAENNPANESVTGDNSPAGNNELTETPADFLEDQLNGNGDVDELVQPVREKGGGDEPPRPHYSQQEDQGSGPSDNVNKDRSGDERVSRDKAVSEDLLRVIGMNHLDEELKIGDPIVLRSETSDKFEDDWFLRKVKDSVVVVENGSGKQREVAKEEIALKKEHLPESGKSLDVDLETDRPRISGDVWGEIRDQVPARTIKKVKELIGKGELSTREFRRDPLAAYVKYRESKNDNM